MGNDVRYNCLEFNGELLNPSFSIYLFEIFKGKKKYCYVGMTGDNHYPSARSILHRLSGHIDLSKQSTQSQLQLAILDLFGKKKGQRLTLGELKTLQIKLHHWAIPGFKIWKGDMKSFDKDCSEYKAYDKKRKRVTNLENKIISDFNEFGLLNKTPKKAVSELNTDELNIFNAIEKIIK